MLEVHIPRFFFDYFDGSELHEAEADDGLELSDANAAFLEAFKAATEVWSEAVRARRNPMFDYFRIRDRNGVVILELPFSEVLESGRGGRPILPPVRLRSDEAQRVHRQLERGRKIVADQRDRVARLKALQRDTAVAERTLDNFTNVLTIFEKVLSSVQALQRVAI